jgi:hypothetical protein
MFHARSEFVRSPMREPALGFQRVLEHQRVSSGNGNLRTLTMSQGHIFQSSSELQNIPEAAPFVAELLSHFSEAFTNLTVLSQRRG